jgi:hypothetical protein
MASWRRVSLVAAIFGGGLLAATPMPAAAATHGFIRQFESTRQIASTVPTNGDLNPYGLAVVPRSIGDLKAGDALVSNFNNGGSCSTCNLQGTGTTIVEISPSGDLRLFAAIDPKTLPGACPGGVGLTTALVALRSGWVIVGSLPTSDGTSATMQAGCLLVLNSRGKVVRTISGGNINGPWDMTAVESSDRVTLFVTNVLNGTVASSPNVVNGGTVVRLVLSTEDGSLQSSTVVGKNFPERTDSSSLVVGPTGVGFRDGSLFVADSVNSGIVRISNALQRNTATGGLTVSVGGALKDPLGLTMAPNGDILTVNGGDGNIVETTRGGAQVAVKTLDTTPATSGSPGNGALFGVAVPADRDGVYFVDDSTNTLNILE